MRSPSAILDRVTKSNASAEQNLPFRRGIMLNHAVLDLDRTPHGVNDAAEFHQNAVAGARHDVAVMNRDARLIRSVRRQPRHGALFVGSREATIPSNIRCQNRGELAGSAHCP